MCLCTMYVYEFTCGDVHWRKSRGGGWGITSPPPHFFGRGDGLYKYFPPPPHFLR